MLDIRSIKRPLLIFVTLFFILQACMPVQAELPEFFNFDENYYTVYGGPNLSATFIGDNEFSRGDEVTINLDLMNKGVVTGFESEDEPTFGSDLEQKLQKSEMGYEAQRTTAIGIIAALNSSSPYVKIKSGSQEAGTLPSGEQLEDPVRFDIEISKNAPAGTYPLMLDLNYGYQENVQVNGDNETDIGITNMEVGLWYAEGYQNQTIDIVVKEAPEFEVVDVEGNLYAGEEGLLYVTYENTGEEAVKDATVRISADDPFSTTDDQSFIGSLAPGETAEAVFKLKVDETAVSKSYAINSEIKYEDTDGHNQISDTLKIRTETVPGQSALESLSGYTWLLGILAIGVIGAGGYFVYGKFVKK
ncbi:hypothetical protein V7O62_06185 [Methanolobus sp. ZRKC2]|uniref:COG1361 S-layer family protein n=1 Tax=Methanolobus sp. ZRKC2 TaxID=3125783 RepID=UPI00324ED9D1